MKICNQRPQKPLSNNFQVNLIDINPPLTLRVQTLFLMVLTPFFSKTWRNGKLKIRVQCAKCLRKRLERTHVGLYNNNTNRFNFNVKNTTPSFLFCLIFFFYLQNSGRKHSFIWIHFWQNCLIKLSFWLNSVRAAASTRFCIKGGINGHFPLAAKKQMMSEMVMKRRGRRKALQNMDHDWMGLWMIMISYYRINFTIK